MATYKIDASHSEVNFKVKHLVISTVTGHFNSYDATMTADKPDFSDASVNFEADVNSISTKSEQRDAHLKGDDFFSADKYPKITFKSTSVDRNGDKFILHGDLTIRDVTKSISLNVEHGGSVVDPWGNTREGFELTGKINRKDFGLVWHGVTETGSIVVSDDVKFLINVEMIKQA